MPKDIDKPEFWRRRIETAVKPHYSVYVIHERGWKEIFDAHRKTVGEVIPAGSRVLDAGCGYGRMCELFDPVDYHGVDFSPDFIRLAREGYPLHQFTEANLKSLPFGDGEFDWAFCVSIRKMVVDNTGEGEWKLMETELKRVAGKVLILEYEDPKPFEIL